MTDKELTKIRESLNLTKTDLAKKLSITPMLLGKYEKGTAAIPEAIINAVQELMGAIVQTAPDATKDVDESTEENVTASASKESEGTLSIPDFVKSVRSGLGLSQKAFADLLGVSGASVGFYENGKNAPRDKVLEKIKELAAQSVSGSSEEKVETVNNNEELVDDDYLEVAEEEEKTDSIQEEREVKLVIQSTMGGSITAEEVLAKIPTGAETVYVKPEENKAYWVKGRDSGAVDLW